MPTDRIVKNAVMVAIFTVLCIVGLEFLAINIGQPPHFGRDVRAVFSDADGVPTAADVRVAGVVVGKVTAVGHDPRFPASSVVTMNITDGNLTLHGNAIAKVKPKTLLGEKFVDLQVGNDAGGPLIDDTIPQEQTGKSVANDEIFNAFDKQTRDQQKQVLQALDAATTGRSGDIQQILPQLQAVVHNLSPLARVYEKDNPEVDTIFVNLDTVMRTLADEHQQLAGLLANGNVALGAIAQKDDALIGTLREFSNVAAEFNAAAAPTVDAQRQSLQRLAPTLDSLSRFLDQIEGPHCANNTKPCGIDALFTGTLLGQINYPSDQLTVSNVPGEIVANEWATMFSYPRNGFDPKNPNPSNPADPANSHSALNITASIQCDTFTKNANLSGFLGQNKPLSDLILQLCGQAIAQQPGSNGTGAAPATGSNGNVTASSGSRS
ncbi:MAG: MCE family protein [Chloroflexi bacterium]|nr:MAG: MCE family protein [Chloroflexota bacterium]